MFFIKKISIILAIVILIIYSYKETSKVIIPSNSIRIRVVANSNNLEDQLIKLKVKDKVEKDIYNKLSNTKDINEARTEIQKDLINIENIVSSTINSNKYNINYGNNYFPEKELNGIRYEPGNYESLVIKLGEGKGNNWWCVLFPPLCTVDVKKNDTDFVEYKSKILEILKEYK